MSKEQWWFGNYGNRIQLQKNNRLQMTIQLCKRESIGEIYQIQVVHYGERLLCVWGWVGGKRRCRWHASTHCKRPERAKMWGEKTQDLIWGGKNERSTKSKCCDWNWRGTGWRGIFEGWQRKSHACLQVSGFQERASSRHHPSTDVPTPPLVITLGVATQI